jgi:hypothetical protein
MAVVGAHAEFTAQDVVVYGHDDLGTVAAVVG